MIDPHNCGTVGHDCLGGTCNAGLCAPVVLFSTQFQLYDLAVDASYVYFTQPSVGAQETGLKPGHVLRVPITGGAVENLETTYCGDLALNDSAVFYMAAGLMSIPLAGGSAQTLNADVDWFQIFVRSDRVYGIGNYSNIISLQNVPTTGGSKTTLVANMGSLRAFDANNSTGAWIDTNSILAVPLDGGAVQTVVTLNSMTFDPFAIDDSFAYFADVAAQASNLMRIPLAGGQPQTVTALHPSQQKIGLDDTSIFLAYQDDPSSEHYAIDRVAKTGGAGQTIAHGSGQLAGRRLVMDAVALYYIVQSCDSGNCSPPDSYPTISVIKLAK